MTTLFPLPPDLSAHFFSSFFKRNKGALDVGDDWGDDRVGAAIAGTGVDELSPQRPRPGQPAFLLVFNPIDRVTRKEKSHSLCTNEPTCYFDPMVRETNCYKC